VSRSVSDFLYLIRSKNPRPMGVVRVNWLCLDKLPGCWSAGVLECWSTGFRLVELFVLERKRHAIRRSLCLVFFITPILHETVELRIRLLSPLWG